ncbi:MAG TPA: alpha/beta hydrolase [Beijerinckiaceae bacterium]|jgi:pimeloyl-ACP methyl ester carboxylesterase
MERFVPTSDGVIHCHVAGEGEALLLLHSNGASAHEYEHVLNLLAERHRVIAWDMPGHGDSDAPVRRYDVEDYAAAAVALLDALEIDRAHVAGSSIGGSITIALGARHPSRVRTLMPIETPVRTPEEWAAGWFQTEKMFGAVTQAQDQVAPRFRSVDADFMARWNVDRAKAGARGMIGVMWALRRYDVLADAARVGAPTLLLYGDRGPTAARAPQLAARIPGARTATIADAQHFPMIDDPEAFARATLDFTRS